MAAQDAIMPSIANTKSPTQTPVVCDPLLAWSATDKRWRELYNIVSSEQFISSSSSLSQSVTPTSKGVKTKRPLLLYFPFHNQPEVFGCYRAVLLMNRWTQNITRIGTLLLFFFIHSITLHFLSKSFFSSLALIFPRFRS